MLFCSFLTLRRPPVSTRPATLFPYPTLFRSPLADARLLDKHDPRFLVGARTLSDIPADESLSDGRGKRNSPCAGPVRIARDQPHRRLLILIFEADTARARGLTTRRPLIFPWPVRSEEHTSELQSLMRSSYAVFCLKKKK